MADAIAKFLIAGAGGKHGATGNLAVRQLLARKLPVRAFVFHADERSEHLAALGAEIVVGDLHDITAVRGAMRGVARAYFTYPIAERLLEATTIFAAAASARGSSKPRRAPALAGRARPRLVRHRRHPSATAVLSRELSHFNGENGLRRIEDPLALRSGQACASVWRRSSACHRRRARCSQTAPGQDVHSHRSTIALDERDDGDLRPGTRQAGGVRRFAGRALGPDPGAVSAAAVLDRTSLPRGGGSPMRRVRRGDRRRSENRGSAPEIARDLHLR